MNVLLKDVYAMLLMRQAESFLTGATDPNI